MAKSLYDLGYEMGSKLTATPYEDYTKRCASMTPEQREKAMEEFYRGAEDAQRARGNSN